MLVGEYVSKFDELVANHQCFSLSNLQDIQRSYFICRLYAKAFTPNKP